MHVRVCVCVRVHVLVRVCVRVRLRARACARVCVHARARARARVRVRECVRACACACACACAPECMYIFICSSGGSSCDPGHTSGDSLPYLGRLGSLQMKALMWNGDRTVRFFSVSTLTFFRKKIYSGL